MEKTVPDIDVFTQRSGINENDVLVGIRMTEYRDGYPYHTISRVFNDNELRTLIERLSIFANMNKK